MELAELIASANQFKSAEEKVAFFIGYQTGAAGAKTSTLETGIFAKQPKLSKLQPGRGKITPRKVSCGHCGKKFITNIACKRFCSVEDNQKCYQDRKGKYELEARNKRLAENAAKTKAKNSAKPAPPMLNFAESQNNKTPLAEALIRAKAEAENDRRRQALRQAR